MKIIERIKINNQFRGIFISGLFLFLLVFFDFLHVSRIIIPVKPPETTPPIPRIFVKLRKPHFEIRRYIINGTIEVNRKFIFGFNFFHYVFPCTFGSRL